MGKLKGKFYYKKSSPSKYDTDGSLIELFVAMVIILLGLFALASLQVKIKQNAHHGQFSALVTTYVAYNVPERSSDTSLGKYDVIELAPNCVTCTYAEYSKMHAYQWNQLVTKNLDVLDAGVRWRGNKTYQF